MITKFIGGLSGVSLQIICLYRWSSLHIIIFLYIFSKSDVKAYRYWRHFRISSKRSCCKLGTLSIRSLTLYPLDVLADALKTTRNFVVADSVPRGAASKMIMLYYYNCYKSTPYDLRLLHSLIILLYWSDKTVFLLNFRS